MNRWFPHAPATNLPQLSTDAAFRHCFPLQTCSGQLSSTLNRPGPSCSTGLWSANVSIRSKTLTTVQPATLHTLACITARALHTRPSKAERARDRGTGVGGAGPLASQAKGVATTQPTVWDERTERYDTVRDGSTAHVRTWGRLERGTDMSEPNLSEYDGCGDGFGDRCCNRPERVCRGVATHGPASMDAASTATRAVVGLRRTTRNYCLYGTRPRLRGITNSVLPWTPFCHTRFRQRADVDGPTDNNT